MRPLHLPRLHPSRGLAFCALVLTACGGSPLPPPPETAETPVYDTVHGVELVDGYRWLEDQERPETRAWIEAQNTYAGSNGGLLVGAALTQRPDLYKAVVCAYPLLDMIRYHRFLAARYWVPEYGSSEDPEQFRYLLAYSPYHTVQAGTAYPATLFITGDGDTRVAPLHARKMTALLQAANGGRSPILILDSDVFV